MEITQTNINEFYNLVQDQLSKITTKEGLDINNFVKIYDKFGISYIF
jgi:hypothetical protein